MPTSTAYASYDTLLSPLDEVPSAPASLERLLGDGTQLPSPQGSMPWILERWTQRLAPVPGAAEFLLDVAASPLDRAAALHHVSTANDQGRTDLAFVAAMVWGYGKAGYGPYRTLRALSGGSAQSPGLDESVLARLREASEHARERGPLAGFYTLNNAPGKVRGLGPAFFTKWLYFTTAVDGPDDAAAASILDQRVRRWIADNTEIRLNIGKTRDYARYLQILDAWGARAHGTVSRAVVERSIFALS